MNRIFDRIFGSTVDYPIPVTMLVVLLSVLSVIGMQDPEILLGVFRGQEETEQTESPEKKSKKRESVPDVDAVSLSDSDAIMVVVGDDFFTKEGSRAISDVIDSIDELPYVDSILWMENVPVLNLFGLRESI